VYLPDGQARSFSMASLPNSGEIDFHIRKVPGGRFTDLQLGHLKAGDRLDVELPLGSFHYRKEDDRPLLMVATGTGLAPIKSILESLMDDDDAPPIRLYWGVCTEPDLYLHDEIERWKDRLCDFQYIPVLSDPGSSWTGRRGFVQHAVAEDLADLSEYAVYMCGSPNMIRDAKSVFLTLGASVDHIYSDSFNLAHQIESAPVAV
jgi:CDP-4-dehydro-6-deoxyglucose reductase, E3